MGGSKSKSKSQSNNGNVTAISTESTLNTLEIVIFLKNLMDEEHNIKKLRNAIPSDFIICFDDEDKFRNYIKEKETNNLLKLF